MVPTYFYKGFVTRIIDAYRIVVLVDLGFGIKSSQTILIDRILIPFINSQEERDKSSRAKAFVETALILREVVLNSKVTSLGNYCADIYYQDHVLFPQKNLADELIKAGHAQKS